MSKDFVQSQLDAGGLVFTHSKSDEKVTETMVARTYGAPVLGNRVVVRLTSDRLVPAEDLAMEFLGLEGRAVSEPIAKQNRTALDFAHWALIHEPKHAKEALDLVKRMKGTARKAASKPGAAWDAYAEMADDLNKSVRNFLPAFWEQAARAFKEVGNTTYAGRALNKALEAERVHSLKVDREHRRDAVLEFALSGCLSGKALSDYSKDLSQQFTPAEAFETYKDLVIRRTLGGMPPVAAMPTDLNRMAKAAGLDAGTELESVLETIIPSPGMSRAPLQFWKMVKPQVKKIIARNESFAMWLLVHTNPQSSYRTDSPVWQWLELLDEWGVLAYLSKPAMQLPSDVEIPGGRAGWLSRLLNVETSPDKRVFDLIEQMAVVLKEENQPIVLTASYQRGLDVDVVDTCLDLGINIVAVRQQFDLNFDGWLRETVDHPRRNSQLNHLAKDERFTAALRDKIPELTSFAGDGSSNSRHWGRQVAFRRRFEEAAAGKPVIRDAWWAYLDQQLKLLEFGGLVDFEQAMNHLTKSVRHKTAVEFPELVKRLRAVDVSACLHRTLLAGVFDEYGWKQLDDLADEKPLPIGNQYGKQKVFPMFPRLTYLQDLKLRTVDPEHASPWRELQCNSGHSFQYAMAVGDDVAILYQDQNDGWSNQLCWLSEPNKSIKQEQSSYYFSRLESAAQITIGPNQVFFGTRVVQPGDTVFPKIEEAWFHDGQRFWRKKEDANYDFSNLESEAKPTLAEIDPHSGKEIRDSVPPWFEESMPSGGRLNWHFSYLQPQPKQSGHSPCGSKHDLIGMRIVHRRDGAIESLGIDGRRFVFESETQPSSGYLAAVAMIEKPGTDSFWVLTNHGDLVDVDSGIKFGQLGDKNKYYAGQPILLPRMFLNLMRPRCEISSKTLRKLSIRQASCLLDAAKIEHEAVKKKEDPENADPNRQAVRSAVIQLLPVAPPRLLTGIARLSRVAAEESISLAALLRNVDPDPADESQRAKPRFDTQRADDGFHAFQLTNSRQMPLYSRTGEGESLSTHIAAVGQFIGGSDLAELPSCNVYWQDLLINLPKNCWNTFWRLALNDDSGLSVAERLNGPWLDAIVCLADSKLSNSDSLMLYWQQWDDASVNTKTGLLSQLAVGKPITHVEGKVRYVLYRYRGYPNDVVVALAFASDGKPAPPKELVFERSSELAPGWNRHHLNSFVEGVRKTKVLPLVPKDHLVAAAQRLGVHEIAVAILWMGNLRTNPYGQEKLTKELRDFYGWKVKDIQLAITELASIAVSDAIGSTGVRNNPGGAMLDGSSRAFEQMIEAWEKAQKKTIQLPAEVTKELSKLASGYYAGSIKQFTDLLADPATCELLRRRKMELTMPKKATSYQPIVATYVPQPPKEMEFAFSRIIKALSIINYELPVKAEARLSIPAAVDAIREFLNDTTTVFSFGATITEFPASSLQLEATLSRLSSSIGKLKQESDGLYRCDTGLITMATLPPHVMMYFYTSKLLDEKSYALLLAAAGQTADYEGPGSNNMDMPNFVLAMRSDAVSQLAKDNREGVLPEGSWEQDPRASVPATLAACAKKLKLNENAAAMFLQILALADPTSANVKRWNGWSSKLLNDTAAELVAAEHLVTAKRERAGRDVFLPGGWEPLKTPNLPIETWKLSLFGYANTERLRGGDAERIVCEGSIGRLFETAWQRYDSGDVPRYEEANMKRKRK